MANVQVSNGYLWYVFIKCLGGSNLGTIVDEDCGCIEEVCKSDCTGIYNSYICMLYEFSTLKIFCWKNHC